MASNVEKIRIQNGLISLGQAAPFYAVTYSSTTKLANEIDTAVDPQVAPDWVAANEIQSEFSVDRRNGRGRILSRTMWVWSMVCKFKTEVTAHEAEAAWLASPPTLAKSAEFSGQVTLDLIRTNYIHPTKQQSHSGSQIEFTFEARLSRR